GREGPAPATMPPAASARRPAPGPASGPTPSGPPAPASPSPAAPHEDVSGEDLLVRSLRATLGLAEQFGEMREVKNRLSRRIMELESLQALARDMSMRRDGDSILSGL